MEKLELTEPVSTSRREKDIYRTLRTNIEFAGVEKKVILITSCAPNDGKSTVAFNLARALADNGKNVLLVDADMRNSVLISRYQIKGKPAGLSHFLSGQASLQDIIYSTDKKRFFITPPGKNPANPTELLENGRFQKAMETLRATFDYVIVDAPPVGLVVDAVVAAKYCDATLCVVASRANSRKMVRNIIGQLKVANPSFLGIVLNKVDAGTSSYGYGYGYGYGYYGKNSGYYGYYGKPDDDTKPVTDDDLSSWGKDAKTQPQSAAPAAGNSAPSDQDGGDMFSDDDTTGSAN